MSRIGNRILAIPAGVEVTVEGNTLIVKGPKGELQKTFDENIKFEVKDSSVVVTRLNDEISSKSLHGTTNALIRNMMTGVCEGFSKSLEIIGVGYRFNIKGDTLIISAGYSHPVEKQIPANLKVEAKGNNEITVSGIDKEIVGQFASEIRAVRKPEPYKGKGIRYVGEYVRRKEGKKAK